MNYFHRNQSNTNPLLFFAGLALGAVFGPVIKRKLNESETWNEMKDNARDKYDQAREKGQDAYNRVVDEVTDKYARAKGISKHELVDLVDDLKMHLGRIKQAWKE